MMTREEYIQARITLDHAVLGEEFLERVTRTRSARQSGYVGTGDEVIQRVRDYNGLVYQRDRLLAKGE